MGDLHRTYRFKDGRLLETEAPGWFAKAIANSDHWRRSLSEAGATGMEEFDNGGESLEIYEGPQGEYFIDYRDAAKNVAQIFIDNVADYLLFRATYITPIAKLIMETERHDEWRKSKKIKIAS